MYNTDDLQVVLTKKMQRLQTKKKTERGKVHIHDVTLRGVGDARHVHQLGLEPVDEGAEGDATLPRGRQVRDGHIPVALRLLLAPGEQPRRPDLGVCHQTGGL